MNISMKWRAAVAGVIAIALVGAGAVSANAAEGDIVNPQPNGSIGSFYIWDGTTGALADGDPARVYARNAGLIIAGSSTDVLAEIPVPAAAAGFTQVYRFVAKSTELTGGTNTWRAYSPTFASGPAGGLLTDDFQLDSKLAGNNGGIDTVFTEGGDWYVGVAFTTNSGVTPLASVYRTIHVDAATDTWTADAVTVEGPPAADLIVEADLVAPELGSAEPAADSTIVPIAAGAANAGKTLKAGVFVAGTRVELGTVVLDASGNGTVDVAGNGLVVNTAYKLFVYENSGINEVLRGWDSFTLTQTVSTTDTTDLSVEVTNSGRFELVAPAATTIDLGDVRRNRTTTPVALGNVTVFDDRDVLSGWNLNISAAAFQGAGATTVAATALGYSPVGVFLPAGITLGANKLAGEGAFGVLAEGAAGSATGEFEGAVVNTNLTFKAPVNAAKGVHTSTLTLDLVSK
jgi:hypothetical protein